MTLKTIRRQVKNVVYNYSEAQIKAREATSNDETEPTTEEMYEISNLMLPSTGLFEVMTILWKRLNESGKKWRHVYKSLVLIEFLIENGPYEVFFECLDKIHVFKVLTTFQHIEENRDNGILICEKAEKVITLLSKCSKKSSVVMKSNAEKAVCVRCSNPNHEQLGENATTKRVETFVQWKQFEKDWKQFGQPSLAATPTSSAKPSELLSLENGIWGVQISLPTSSTFNDNDGPTWVNLKLQNEPFGGKVLTPINSKSTFNITSPKISPIIQKKIEEFLGEHKNLVNLDDLFESTTANDKAGPSIATN